MKNSLTYVQMHIMNEVMKAFSVSDLAKEMLEILNKGNDESFELCSTSSDGLKFRRRKDVKIDEDMVHEAMVKATRHLISSDLEDLINDRYEFTYDKKYITPELFARITDVTFDGRTISIEIDLQ